MRNYLHPLAWMVFALLIGVRVEASAGDAADQGPTLDATKDWLKDHGKDFTSSFSFSNDSHKRFIMTIQGVGIVFRKYRSKDKPPGCIIIFYANIHNQDDEIDNDAGAAATFRAEDVSDAVQVRKLASTDLGPNAQGFDGQGCYGVVITPKDPNSNAIEMVSLGVPFLEWHKLPYIVIPIGNQAMAERLGKALHHGIQLIQAQTAAKPDAF
jgi:hypothetical protein